MNIGTEEDKQMKNNEKMNTAAVNNNNNDIKNAVDNIKAPKPRRRRSRNHRVGCSNLLLVLVLLFAARRFIPEFEEALPHLYAFLDGVVVPIVDWIYAISMKFVSMLIADPMVAKLLEALRSLAA